MSNFGKRLPSEQTNAHARDLQDAGAPKINRSPGVVCPPSVMRPRVSYPLFYLWLTIGSWLGLGLREVAKQESASVSRGDSRVRLYLLESLGNPQVYP